MLTYDKHEIRKQLTQENIFDLLSEWGGDPIVTSFGILSATICHNPVGEGSRKLYWYKNTDLFRCYSGCEEPVYDIFQLTCKIAEIQWKEHYELNDAVRWIAQKFGLSGTIVDDPKEGLEDWKILENYERLQEIEVQKGNVVLKEYDNSILSRFNYTVKLDPWLNEDINQEVLDHAMIGFYPGDDQITIPHFDKDNRFIGLRGRALSEQEASLYGKYRPLKVNKELYNHPLGFNLYGLKWAKDNIGLFKKAIVVEAEKSVLKYCSYFGLENNICVACCGSSLSAYQANLLLEAGAQEIIIGFDRQFKARGDDEFKRLKNNLLKIREKFKNDAIISFIFDKNMITDYKASPLDHGPDVFLKLFNNRITL